MKLTRDRLKQIIKEELEEMMDLPKGDHGDHMKPSKPRRLTDEERKEQEEEEMLFTYATIKDHIENRVLRPDGRPNATTEDLEAQKNKLINRFKTEQGVRNRIRKMEQKLGYSTDIVFP